MPETEEEIYITQLELDLCLLEKADYLDLTLPSPIAQSLSLRTWEQEVTGLIPGSASILSEDWW